jgi:plasmid stabilization system protein ParE
MAAKPVRFHEDADAEYEDAFDWYLARSPHAAAEFGCKSAF